METTQDPIWWKELLSYVLPIAGTLLSVVLTWAISLLARKLGIDLKEANTDAKKAAAKAAIVATEEWAARESKTTGQPVVGMKKSEHAKKLLAVPYPDLPDTEATMLLDAQLGSTIGVGATGNKAL